MPSTEEKLTGGRITADVTRIGQTVHRSHTVNSDFVKGVLEHLQQKGADFAPHWLGMDDVGRDVFTFIPGEVPDNLGDFTDEQCAAAAKMISRMHDLLKDMPECKGDFTICHRDLSPCNFVFRHGMPMGIIDWDAAAIQEPIYDIAYAIWMWLDIGNDELNPYDVARRMRLMRDEYGAYSIDEICDAMLCEMARVGSSIFPTPEQTRATNEWTQKCASWCRKNRLVLLQH